MSSVGNVTLSGLRGFGFHGVHSEERQNGQTFVVDVSVELDLSRAAESDDLAETIDYAGLAQDVLAIVEGEPCNLIETLADRIAAKVMEDGRLRRVEVTVHKPQAPVGVPFDDVQVTLERER